MPAATSTPARLDTDNLDTDNLALPGLAVQLARLLELGVPALAGRDEAELRSAVTALEPYAAAPGSLLVLTSSWVTPEQAMPLVSWRGKAGFVDLTPTSSAPFLPVESVAVPGEVYLLTGVDTGKRHGGRRPQDVLPEVLASGRTPLTIDEGVSLLLQQPTILKDRTAFSLAGSRAGDRRVPALWTSDGAQRLGWCWDGAVHDWLGFASAASRLA